MGPSWHWELQEALAAQEASAAAQVCIVHSSRDCIRTLRHFLREALQEIVSGATTVTLEVKCAKSATNDDCECLPQPHKAELGQFHMEVLQTRA